MQLAHRTSRSLRCRRLCVPGRVLFANLSQLHIQIHLRILMLLKVYMMNSSSCFLLSSYGLFALNMQSSIGLVIGIDRLYNVSFPLKYRIELNSHI